MKSKYLAISLVALFVLASVWLRILLPWNSIFTGSMILPYENDPYVHMRLVDSLWHNWPTAITIDPYISDTVTVKPILAYSIVIISWIVSLGNVTQQVVDTVGILVPAICGVLLILPVFVISKEMFGKWSAVIASMLVAIYPGEILARTSLGFTDHHAYEILLSSLALMFLVLAFKRGMKWSIGAGVILGLYLLNWAGAPVLLVLLSMYLVVQSIINHMREVSNNSLCCIMLITNAIALMMFIFLDRTIYQRYIYVLAIVLSTLLPVILLNLSYGLKRWRRWIYPTVIAAGGIVCMIAVKIVSPEMFGNIANNLALVLPTGGVGAGGSILETQPVTMQILWGNMNIGIVVGMLGLAAMVYLTVRDYSNEKVLLLVWSLFMVLLSIMQRRFVYYLMPSVAIVVGYATWIGIEKLSVGKIVKGKKRSEFNYGGLTLAIIAVIALLVVPNLRASAKQSGDNPYMISSAWVESLEWLRERTDEPFGSSDYYYKIYDKKDLPICDGKDVERIAAMKQIYHDAYRVLSWWDYGHWIVRIGRRPVVCSPAGGFTVKAATVLVSRDEEEAARICKELGVKYVIVDWHMPNDKWYAMPMWAGVKDVEQKQSMVWRLYNEEQMRHFRKVFESTVKFGKDSQIKIFEFSL